MSASTSPKFSLVVTGDVVIDHHLYRGERDTPTTDQKPGLRDFPEQGGAAVLFRLLEQVFHKDAQWSVHLGIDAPPTDEKPCGHHAYAFWSPQPKGKGEKDQEGEKDKQKKEKQENEKEKNKGSDKVWRVQLPMGYGHQDAASDASNPRQPSLNLQDPKILVLDDAGSMFRHPTRKACWRLPVEGAPEPWIVLKMSQPVAQGDLWHEVVSRFPDRLVCVVSADELRQECARISRGLSWERTVEEVRDALLNNHALAPLAQCRHLIVRFAADGVLWLDRAPSGPRAKLVFDAGGAEGGWEENREGTVFGSSTTLTAAIVYGLARSALAAEAGEVDLVPAIKAGLAAVRNLEEYGHGLDGKEIPNGFPVARLATVMTSAETKFADADVPWKRSAASPDPARVWMIVEESQRPRELAIYPPLVGLARQVVLRGKAVLDRFPHARFGELDTIDRLEIETLRSLRRLMFAYQKNAKAEKPLSIGVFGPPGAGKSFGVKQLAQEIFGEKAWLEFNLSQFNGTIDLVGAFHQVRDKVLSGVTPAVFWDEFDSKENFWLQYLLAPMQDGRFQEGQVSHWIGKCVFVFAGGTSHTYDEFAPPKDAPAPIVRDYKLKKGRDFHSRLDGYYNVVGPNRRAQRRTKWQQDADPKPDPTDVCFPLRRALLIRNLLGRKRSERIDFDSGLLDALLLVPEFKHGVRSLEKVIFELRPKDRGPIRRSALPAPEVLAMHVDAKEFNALLKRNEEFLMSEAIDELAEALHEDWRKSPNAKGKEFDRPFAQLTPIEKDDNRAKARRIPIILSLVGLGLVRQSEAESPDEPPPDFLKDYLESLHLELLAEAEHDGWMEQRLANGWRKGPRSNQKKLHPLLIPYCDLPNEEQEKDRVTIRELPGIVEDAGYRIIWLRDSTGAAAPPKGNPATS
jgi:hypothetical protein